MTRQPPAGQSEARASVASGRVARVVMLSMHTSPLAQPGDGDAGGMNVFVANAARALAARGIRVDCYTLDTAADTTADTTTDTTADTTASLTLSESSATTAGDSGGRMEITTAQAGGFAVHSVRLAAAVGAAKEQLPELIDAWAQAVSAHIAASEDVRGSTNASASSSTGGLVLHSHYWLSGMAGLQIAQALEVPLVHTMHTIGAVKNLRALAAGGSAETEPAVRIDSEALIASRAARLTANTAAEADDLVRFCGANASSVNIVAPGVDIDVFQPGDRQTARARFNLAGRDFVLSFVGRLQPHKGPDLAIAAVAEFLNQHPGLRDSTRLIMCGGASGIAGFSRGDLTEAASKLGIAGQLHFTEPLPPAQLADLYRASDVLLLPSISESFGLVALEAQACGTPVVATADGGLTTCVRDGHTGFLVASRTPADWASAISRLLDPNTRQTMSEAATSHAANFTWQATANQLLQAFEQAQL